MNQMTGKGMQVVKELPTILRKFAKEAKRNKLDTVEDFNVFATRYFAKQAGYHVEGYPDLTDPDPWVVHVFRAYDTEEPVKEVEEPTWKEEAAPEAPEVVAAPKVEEKPSVVIPDAPFIEININPAWQSIEHQVYAEVCALRANPMAYANKIESLNQYYVERLKSFTVPGGVILSSQEGWSAYEECIQELRRTAPLAKIEYSTALTVAAVEGMTESGAEVPPRQLCERYGLFNEELGSSVAQSLCFNQLLAQSIVLHLMIDDNYSSRGNRRNLLSEEYQSIGISFHSVTCNMIFASNYTPKNALPDLAIPAVPADFTYNLELNNSVFQTVPKAELDAIISADITKAVPEATEQNQVIEVEFEDKPLKMTLLSPASETVTVEGNELTAILAHSAGHLTAILQAVNGDVKLIDKGCLIQSLDGVAIVQTHFPEPGQYSLSISADLEGGGVYTQVFDYKITANCHSQPPREFPATFLQSHSCYVYHPQTWAVGTSGDGFVPFVVKSQAADIAGLAILTGDELLYLQKQEDPTVWAGKVKTQQGACKISLNLLGTHYEVFGMHSNPASDSPAASKSAPPAESPVEAVALAAAAEEADPPAAVEEEPAAAAEGTPAEEAASPAPADDADPVAAEGNTLAEELPAADGAPAVEGQASAEEAASPAPADDADPVASPAPGEGEPAAAEAAAPADPPGES